MDQVPDFDKADYSLHAVNLALWEGLIFVNLADSPTPLEEWFAPLNGKFSHWNLPKLRAAKRIEYDVKANWKLMFENYSECYHCPGVHPMLSKVSPYDSAENDLTEGPFLGGFMKINKGAGLTMSGKACALPVGQDRESPRGFLLFDFSEHAPLFTSGICDAASALAAVAGADTNLVRLVFSSGRVQSIRFQAGGRDRVLGYD